MPALGREAEERDEGISDSLSPRERPVEDMPGRRVRADRRHFALE